MGCLLGPDPNTSADGHSAAHNANAHDTANGMKLVPALVFDGVIRQSSIPMSLRARLSICLSLYTLGGIVFVNHLTTLEFPDG